MTPDQLFDYLKRAANGEDLDNLYAEALDFLCYCSLD